MEHGNIHDMYAMAVVYAAIRLNRIHAIWETDALITLICLSLSSEPMAVSCFLSAMNSVILHACL